MSDTDFRALEKRFLSDPGNDKARENLFRKYSRTHKVPKLDIANIFLDYDDLPAPIAHRILDAYSHLAYRAVTWGEAELIDCAGYQNHRYAPNENGRFPTLAEVLTLIEAVWQSDHSHPQSELVDEIMTLDRLEAVGDVFRYTIDPRSSSITLFEHIPNAYHLLEGDLESPALQLLGSDSEHEINAFDSLPAVMRSGGEIPDFPLAMLEEDNPEQTRRLVGLDINDAVMVSRTNLALERGWDRTILPSVYAEVVTISSKELPDGIDAPTIYSAGFETHCRRVQERWPRQ